MSAETSRSAERECVVVTLCAHRPLCAWGVLRKPSFLGVSHAEVGGKRDSALRDPAHTTRPLQLAESKKLIVYFNFDQCYQCPHRVYGRRALCYITTRLSWLYAQFFSLQTCCQASLCGFLLVTCCTHLRKRF